MPKKLMTFNAALEPLTDEMPEGLAAAIGATVARHAYLASPTISLRSW